MVWIVCHSTKYIVSSSGVAVGWFSPDSPVRVWRVQYLPHAFFQHDSNHLHAPPEGGVRSGQPQRRRVRKGGRERRREGGREGGRQGGRGRLRTSNMDIHVCRSRIHVSSKMEAVTDSLPACLPACLPDFLPPSLPPCLPPALPPSLPLSLLPSLPPSLPPPLTQRVW